jgi:hypothetical protein
LNTVQFSFESANTKVIHNPQEAPKIAHPEQTPDGEEYICGNPGPEYPDANPGRDQDVSRLDEYHGAMPFARYVG